MQGKKKNNKFLISENERELNNKKEDKMWRTILSIVAVLCAIWVIYDVFTNQKKFSDGEKVLWTILAIFFNIITAIVYYFLKKR